LTCGDRLNTLVVCDSLRGDDEGFGDGDLDECGSWFGVSSFRARRS